MTVLDLIKSSLRLLNVYASGETPSSEDSTDALSVLNMLIDQWSIDGLMVFQIFDESFSLVDGTSSYTIGSAATFNTVRPNKIDSAYIVDSANTSFSLRIIDSQAYNAISEKSTVTGHPSRLYYSSAHPVGTLYFWPVPDYAYTLKLSSWKQLSTFTALTDTITLPPGYEMALRYSLAVELAPEYGKAVSPDIAGGAQRHKAAVMRINNRMPYMTVDRAVLGRGEYDINSDAYL